MDTQRLIRCAADDPRRCQSAHANIQCPYLAEPDEIYCSRHIPALASRAKKTELRNYYLTKFRAKLEQKVASPRIKTLTEEVGILRMVLQEVLEGCQSDFDLVLYSSKITEIVTCIRATLDVSMKIEEKANLTLDKSQVSIVAGRIIGIISQRLNESDIAIAAEEIIAAFDVEKD